MKSQHTEFALNCAKSTTSMMSLGKTFLAIPVRPSLMRLLHGFLRINCCQRKTYLKVISFKQLTGQFFRSYCIFPSVCFFSKLNNIFIWTCVEFLFTSVAALLGVITRNTDLERVISGFALGLLFWKIEINFIWE